MPRQGRLNRNRSGLSIADFADHDDVGILAQNGSKRVGKLHGLGVAHLNLVDQVELVFHGVFDSDNIAFYGLNQFDGGVEGGCFSAACWAGR